MLTELERMRYIRDMIAQEIAETPITDCRSEQIVLSLEQELLDLNFDIFCAQQGAR